MNGTTSQPHRSTTPKSFRVRSLFRPIRKPVAWFLARRPIRKFYTRNFSTGLLAFGEKNLYLIPPRWITVDIEHADFNYDLRSRSPFPFATGSQQVIFSSHCIEHIDNDSLRFFLEEAHRILRPGGTLRLEAPDADRLYSRYLDSEDPFFETIQAENRKKSAQTHASDDWGKRHTAFIGLISCYVENGSHIPVVVPESVAETKLKCLSKNDFFDWCISLQTQAQYKSGGHINPITHAKLETLLSGVGFTSIAKCENGQTRLPLLNLKGIERPDRASYSLYVEAIKA